MTWPTEFVILKHRFQADLADWWAIHDPLTGHALANRKLARELRAEIAWTHDLGRARRFKLRREAAKVRRSLKYGV